MKFSKRSVTWCLMSVICFMFISVPTMAADDMDAMKARIEALERELSEMKTLLEKQMQQAATKEEVQAVRLDVEFAKGQQEEWKTHDSSVHLGGYSAISWTDDDSSNDRFNQVSYNPIFHYSYKDLILMEAELEMEIEEDGETEVGLEYLTIDWFMNDYMVLLAGKFLSPIGQFRQHLHPAWVNKLPTAPAGFGHDQAAPLNDIGIELRGGLPIGAPMALNYALFVGNGPNEIELNEDGDEIEAVETAGSTSNEDNNYLFGGRLGFIPMTNVEIGVSGAFGDVALEDEGDRDYDVLGFDAFGRWKELDFRAEYVRQKLGSLGTSVAPDSQEWEAWYAQFSYKLSQIPHRFINQLELVARYSDYDSNHADQKQEQWTWGLNYLIAPQAMVKFGYEFNDGLAGEPTDEDRLLIQLGYGF